MDKKKKAIIWIVVGVCAIILAYIGLIIFSDASNPFSGCPEYYIQTLVNRTNQEVESLEESVLFFRGFLESEEISSNDISLENRQVFEALSNDPVQGVENKELWVFKNSWAVDSEGNVYEIERGSCF